MKARHAAAFVMQIGFCCLAVGGGIYLGFVDRRVNPEHSAMFFIWAGAALVEGIRKTVQKWRLLRSGEEVPLRMQEAVTPPTIDPQ